MRKTYRAEGIAVSYDARLCIHAKRCVEGLPAVFDPKARPWIRPEAAAPDVIADVVRRCPTGALAFERPDGAAETADAAVTITMDRDGPLFVRGGVRLVDGSGEAWSAGPRFALCRCGGSGNKPFCDGSHRSCGFRAAEVARPPI